MPKCQVVRFSFLVLVLLTAAATPAWCQENILISISNFYQPGGEIREYTQAGAMLWSEMVPSPDPTEDEDPRDLTVNNGIHVMQNVFPVGSPIQAYLSRFDLDNNYAVDRFGITADNQFALEIIDINMGLDCKLYALEVDPGGGVPDIHIYDPDSFEYLGKIDLTDYLLDFLDDFDARGVAVAANGDISGWSASVP